MKFTFSWLKDHLDTTASLPVVTDTLTAIGLEVEQVIDHAAGLEGFIVAEIKEAAPHPGADKLRVCRVDDGSVIRQVVCGASNARAGIKVALAREGVKIPQNGMVIKKTSIRGVESDGMLCSAHELGIGEDGGGIIELPASAVPGSRLADTLGLDDQTIEIAVTPNRADCLGVNGIARDLVAAGVGKLRHARSLQLAMCDFSSPIRVTLNTPACPLFVGCYIKGVRNRPSPKWLQNRLKAVGLRPVSALVDITNYMTVTYGRPLHVFDARKISGHIHVRSAREGEKLLALNDKEYTLSSDMIAVCDASGVIGLGGVIGGLATGCSDNTTDVFLESALFDPAHIAMTGRKLGIDSDARHRFERGVDPEFAKPGAETAIHMILDLCGGEASELVIAGSVPKWRRTLTFDPKKVATLGGVALAPDKINGILAALGFTVKGNAVSPPSWRADIEGNADLVEEVLRIHRYDNIPSVALPEEPAEITPPPLERRMSQVRKTLVTDGMTEICSFAFLAEAQATLFGGGRQALLLANPISSDLDAMRPNLLPNLISALKRNIARGFFSLALFETGNVFEDVTPQGQKPMTAGIRSGDGTPRNHLGDSRPAGIFDAKADLFAVLEAAGVNPEKLHVDRNTPGWYHPARSGRISLGGKVTLGFFGEIHPLTLSAFDVKQPVMAFEAFLDAIPYPRAKSRVKPPYAVSNFQSVERDFAFIADGRIAASDVIKAVESVEKQLIQSVEMFDVYAGKGVEAGKKSVAVSVLLQAMDRTLSEKEITDISQKIIATATDIGLALRG